MNPNERQPNQPSLSKQPTTPPPASPGKTPTRPVPASGDSAHTQSGRHTLGGASAGSTPGESLDIERKVFAERFDLLEELGSGGMGRVLKAFDRKLQRAVAVKRIKGPLATDPDLLRRFLREAQFAARLNHPNVVTVHDILTDDEGPYLVLEFIDGETLADRLQRSGAIPWREAIDLLLPICEGVAHAHEQGIIHRDIKPANLLVSKKGTPKLGDFGIARSLKATEFTQTGALIGTLDYMAPEQMDSSKTAEERADIYSLAATLYHMVTGEPPRPIMPSELPVELQAVILQAVQRQPQKRQANLMEFEDQLRACGGPKPSVSVSPPVEQIDSASPIIAPPASPKIVAPCSAQENDGFANVGPKAGERKTFKLKGIEYAFRWCPPGKFTMGSPENEAGHDQEQGQVLVELTKGFWMQETVVTQAMWSAVMASQPWRDDYSLACLDDGEKEGPNYPATYVDWNSATEFCHQLAAAAQAAGVLSLGLISLPTEAQWEYACRAGTTTAYSFGDDESQLGEYAWFDENASNINENYAHAVKMKKPNSWGLYDMHGNVEEWCQDMDRPQLPGGRDPVVTTSTRPGRMLRGGSWDDPATSVTSASRVGDHPESELGCGFRMSLEFH